MIQMAQRSSKFHWLASRPVLCAILLAAIIVCPTTLAHHRPGHGGGPGGGGEEDTWSFHAESSGDVTGYYNSKEYAVSSDVQNLVFNKTGGNDYWLSDYFVVRDYDGRSGEECFVSSGINRAGTMQLYDNFGNDSDLVARLWFRASNDPVDPNDKIDDLQYVLTLYDDGQGWLGPFPPDQAAPSYREATRWKLGPARKGSRRNEPCESGGIVDFPLGDGVEFSVIQNP